MPLFPLFLHPSGTLFPFLAGGNSSAAKKRLYKKVQKFANIKHSSGMMRS
ncbi:MAG: hypothetical protein R2874_13575 [Desulfobacterales bacterium]